MKKQRQGVWSAKVKENEPEEEIPDLGTYTDEPTYHTIQITSHAPKPKKINDVYIKIHNTSKTKHSNFNGQFPAISSRGNQNIMVLVEVDGHYIDAEPMKYKTEGSIIKASLIIVWARLMASGTVKPTTHLLDNKHQQHIKRRLKRIANIS
jgi:hypothetical protein